ncbi:unnamed protein product [Ilex paraguariensis]|uniref:Uncharacterized protein n=1 Tax=Ilex paraguariensis TaxID=185542 RepID=A0ABC8R4V1_9AQUA
MPLAGDGQQRLALTPLTAGVQWHRGKKTVGQIGVGLEANSGMWWWWGRGFGGDGAVCW